MSEEPFKYARDGAPVELAEAQEICTTMIAAMPKDITHAMAIATIGLLCQSVFGTLIKQQYRIGAFEDFAFHIRRQLVDEIRAGGHKP